MEIFPNDSYTITHQNKQLLTSRETKKPVNYFLYQIIVIETLALKFLQLYFYQKLF